MKRLMRAALAALVGLTVLVGPTLAASSGSGTMTLTVGNAISISGVPTSLPFGSAFPGDTATTPQFTVTLQATSSATFTATSSDLAGTPSGTIVKSNVKMCIGNACTATVAADGTTVASGVTTSTTRDVNLAITVPGAAVPATYTGTFTITGS